VAFGRTEESALLGRRERRRLETRSRILEAGMALFERQGIDATRVSEICTGADVAHKTFFNHFPTKRHLLREIAQYSLDQLLADIEAVCKQPVTSAERLRLFFENLADNADEAGPMQRELLTEMVQVAHEASLEHEQARALHDAFASIVKEGLLAGDLTRRHSVETLTEMLMGAFYVLMFNWANLDHYPLRERARETALFLTDSMARSADEPPSESEDSA